MLITKGELSSVQVLTVKYKMIKSTKCFYEKIAVRAVQTVGAWLVTQLAVGGGVGGQQPTQ